MGIVTVIVAYTILCVIVAYLLNMKKSSSVGRLILWSFCISPIGGIIMALKSISENKLDRKFYLNKTK
jgi:hypothetical protein